ncbi:hypothetical protein BH10ACT10_BH10ACT10_17690 [soil metagenome]
MDGMLNLGLSATDIERVMQGVTSGLLSAFNIDWSPDWVKPGDVHAWQNDGNWQARCSVCLLDSLPSPSRDVAAKWGHHHEATH